MNTSLEPLTKLLDAMCKEKLTINNNVETLREELAIHYKDKSYSNCDTMGAIVRKNLESLFEKE